MRRIQISLSADLERRARLAKASVGNTKPFSRFLILLIERGLAELDREILLGIKADAVAEHLDGLAEHLEELLDVEDSE
jgi:hypothetical protein